MDIFITIIFFIIGLIILSNIFKKFFIFVLFSILTLFLYINIELSFLVSIILSIIIFKGIKDTLFNLSVTFRYLFRSKYKFRERTLGKLVSVLFEINFTIFICLCYIFLASYVPYLFDIEFKFIAISFVIISFIQILKQFILKRTYSYYPNRFIN